MTLDSFSHRKQTDQVEAAVLEAAERWVQARQAAGDKADQSQLQIAQSRLIDAIRTWRAARANAVAGRERP